MNLWWKRLSFAITLLTLVFACSDVGALQLDGKLISGIGISGNYPYIDSKIRRYLTIRPSDHYNEATMEEQKERIIDFYKREGWIDSSVTVRPEYVDESDSIYIHIKIKRGFLLRYREIDVVGDYSLPTSLVASKINPWKPYTPRRLRESIRRITATYRKHGYPLARVRLLKTHVNMASRTIDVAVRIEEGPHVRVVFEGNKHLGGLHLKKVLTIFTEGAIDSFELEECVKALKKRYLNRGFPNTRIDFTRDEVADNKILITFHIDEGTPERIRDIEFEGNDDIKSGKIEGAMVSRPLSLIHPGIYDKGVLSNDLKRIDRFYQSRGFPDAEVDLPHISKLYNGTQLVVDIPIVEGPHFNVRQILFEGDVLFPEKYLKRAIKSRVDRPLNFTILEDEEVTLVAFYADRGFPYVTVDLQVIEDPATSSADLHFAIASGPEVRMGPISIVGDFITSQKAILRAAGIKEGDLFSYERLVNGKISLRRLGAFSTVNIDPVGLKEKATTIPLTIRVEEMRPFKLDFDIGYSTDEKLIGGIDFVNRNSFGWGKRTALQLLAGRRYSRGELSWIDPKLAGWDVEMSTSGWLQYENKSVFSYIQAGGGVGFYRRYHRTSYLLRTNFTRNYFLLGSSTAADAESLRNNNIFNTLLSVSFDTRNSFADPTKGVYLSCYTNFYNEIRGQNAHFVKLGTKDGIYWSFAERFTLANDARFESIQTFGKNISVPSNELLLLGGDDSLRGFERDSLGPVNAAGRPTGGRLRLIVNNEFRIGLIDNFKWVFFHDMGFLTNSFSAVTLGQLRHSIGFGLHYITPIGPIKADYGFIIDRQPGEHIGRFHLTFGYIF